jgi:hypothetical protein
MKIVTANGKQKVVMNRKEWESIGKKAGWNDDEEDRLSSVYAMEPHERLAHEMKRILRSVAKVETRPLQDGGYEFIWIFQNTPQAKEAYGDKELKSKIINDLSTLTTTKNDVNYLEGGKNIKISIPVGWK